MLPVLIVFGALALSTPVLFLVGKKRSLPPLPKVLETSNNESLLSLINSLHEIRKSYLQLNLSSVNSLIVSLTLLIESLREVEELLEKTSTEQRQRVVIEYENIGRKLKELLDEEFLLGMLSSSSYMLDDVTEKVAFVEGFLKSFRKEVELNSKQLLEERELDFLLASALLKKRFDEKGLLE